MRKTDVYTELLDGDHDAVELTKAILGATPKALHLVLTLRDRVVEKLGFATQPNPGPVEFEVAPGSSAGPFVFREVGPSAVVGGNGDRHIGFTTTFAVEGRTASLRTDAESRSRLGAAYLTTIWPFHRLLMPMLLARGCRALGRT